MAKDNLDDFELFYQEIPLHHDYLDETEIEDLVEDDTTTSSRKGLNADQVSMLAQDALAAHQNPPIERVKPAEEDDSTQQLF